MCEIINQNNYNIIGRAGTSANLGYYIKSCLLVNTVVNESPVFLVFLKKYTYMY